MTKGTLVEFRVQGTPRLGVLDSPQGRKNWLVLDEQGQVHSIHPRNFTFRLWGSYVEVHELTALREQAESLADPENLVVAWELLQEDGEGTDILGLSRLLFSSEDPPFCYAAYRLLMEDRLYFKQRGDLYEPRTPAQVEELRHQVEREQERERAWNRFLDKVRARVNGETVVWQKEDYPHLEVLEKFAVLGEDCPQKAAAQEILRAIQRQTTCRDSFDLLVDLGLWNVHENLALRRSQIPLQLPQGVAEVAQSRLHNPPPDPDPQRRDLTALKVYTIDDSSTQEIDDGISLEQRPGGGQRVWIHIADPARWVAPGDDLDLDARRRGATLYLPTGMIPMFPLALATGPMSLVQGQICAALSFGVDLTPEGAIADFEIVPSTIRPTYRLTYEDVDEMLSLGVTAEGELLALWDWAQVRQRWRNSQGAIAIHMPECVIEVEGEDTDEPTVDVHVIDDSPARQLVAEMMILAGEVAALYGETHTLPLPYRGQPQPELPPDEELMQLPAGPVRYSTIRRYMPRSEVGLTPTRHATLGLSHYCQVTSPIRRYSDLVAHYQIKAHLRGDPLPFSPEEVMQLVQGAGAAAYEASSVERQTKRYWAIEYLRRQGDQIWSVMVLRWLREGELFGLVLFEDLGLEFALRLDREVALGERFYVQVTRARPRSDSLKVTEVTLEPGQEPSPPAPVLPGAMG